MITSHEIRSTLREQHHEYFSPQPWRALWVPVLFLLAAFGMYLAAQPETPWYVAIPAAVVIANCFAGAGFLAHEALHGSITRNKSLQRLVGFAGFLPFFVSPELWQVWHNQVHHGRTNEGDRDPDGFGTLERYQRLAIARFFTRFAPGSGTWYSYLFLFYWFTVHGQFILWVHSRSRAFARLNRRRAYAELALMVGIWAVAAYVLGVKGTLLGIVLPMLGGNFVVMSYIATNHFLRPQTEKNEPLQNSMSVTVPRWVDAIHFNFSHHVEHHLFPNMSPRFAPKVRAYLQEVSGEQYVAPPHWKAVWYLYRTPRIYKDANTLIDPRTGRTVDVPEMNQRLHTVTLNLEH